MKIRVNKKKVKSKTQNKIRTIYKQPKNLKKGKVKKKKIKTKWMSYSKSQIQTFKESL